MKKILIIGILFMLFMLTSARAEVIYPVAELGNCSSEQECEVYCNDFTNLEKCLNFAEANNMMDEEELKEAKIALPFVEELGCKNQEECEEFCRKDENLMTCIELAYKLGEITQEQYEAMQNTQGIGPGGCKLDECEDYCDDEKNLVECTDFALENGMISEEEAENIKEGGGQGPGGCKNEEECKRYCDKEENIIECVKFAKEHGLIDPEDADLIIEAGGTDRETFDAFCNENLDNWERCTALWVEKGYMTEEEREQSLLYRENRLDDCEPEDEECASEFCSKDENIEECWEYEIAVGEKTQEEYDAWKEEQAEREAEEASSDSSSSSDSGTTEPSG